MRECVWCSVLSSKSARIIVRYLGSKIGTTLILIVILLVILLLSGTLFTVINRSPFVVGARNGGAILIYPYTITFQTSAEALALIIALILTILGYYTLTEVVSRITDNKLANMVYVLGLILFIFGIIIVLMILNIKLGRIF
ncbi:MAG TPA: hypothetical protein EYH40_01910 [Desulfurococcales archaeon]|nr:hypothetical protein [Desulfurococcales archaeon]